MKKFILILVLHCVYVNSYPAGKDSSSSPPPLNFLGFLTFENGNIGVNFGGYHASAGLGGLLTGNAAHGGLQASAGTPNGQKAVAGLGGSVDGEQGTGGNLYAGATAGNGIWARSGIGGNVGSDGVLVGNKYASTNKRHKEITVTKTLNPDPENAQSSA